MKKTLLAFILTIAIFIGVLSSPAALAYNNQSQGGYWNQGCNILNSLQGDSRSIILQSTNIQSRTEIINLRDWCLDLFNTVYGPKTQPETPSAPPEESMEPDPVPNPTNPNPQVDSQPDEEPENSQNPEPESQPQPKPNESPEPDKGGSPINTPPAENPPAQNPPEKTPPVNNPQPKPAPQPEPEKKPENKPSTQAPSSVGGMQGQMLDLVNSERVNSGLKPLIWDGNLAEVAQVKAKDMSDNNYFDHNSPTYGSPFEMMKKFGITYRAAGENLAGSSGVERAHVGLMNSEGHRKNILNPNFTHMGIGVEKSTRYGYVFVQMFVGR